MNKRCLKNWLQFYIININEYMKLNICRGSSAFHNMNICKSIGMIYCVESMSKYFGVSIKPHPIYSLIYIFNNIDNFEDKFISFSNEDVLVPEFIEYPDRFLEGYDGIIEDMRRRLL